MYVPYSNYYAATAAITSASLLLSLIAGLPYFIFTFKRWYYSRLSRIPLDSASWLLIAFSATNLWLIITLAAISLTPSHGAYYGRIDNYTTTQLTITRLLLSPIIYSVIIAVQMRLTLALRRAAGLPDARDRLDRILGPDAVPIPGPDCGSVLKLPLGMGSRIPHDAERLVVKMAGAVGIVRFVAMELFIHRRSFYTIGPMPFIVSVLDFVIALFLLAAALASFGYAAAIDPKTPALRTILRLILATSSITILRQVYELIYAGFFSLTPQMHTVVDSPLWLPVANALLSPLTATICLALLAAALRQDLGGLWELFADWDHRLEESGAGPIVGLLLHPRRRDTNPFPYQKEDLLELE